MKYALAAMVLAAAPWFAGCHSQSENPADRDLTQHQQIAADNWMVNNDFDTAIRAGIIAEHTLYPYDFVAGSARLNPLGWRDLGVLARHYRHIHGGTISLYRGATAAALYAQRVKTVTAALAQAGLSKKQVAIVNQMPAGEGMPSNTVLKILKKPTTDFSSSGGTSAVNVGSSSANGGSQ